MESGSFAVRKRFCAGAEIIAKQKRFRTAKLPDSIAKYYLRYG
jgi:hypothetical protein